MITILTGNNSFEMERALGRIAADFGGMVEKVDGSQLELSQLPDLIMGGTLFASQRLVVISDLSSNKTVWNALGEWIGRVDEAVGLVLVESNLDRRTKTYKALQKVAKVQDFKAWGERDIYQAQQWVGTEAKALGFELDKKCVQKLIDRVGVDQWQLYRSLEKLAVLDTITPAVIEDVIEANPRESVFNLLEAALEGNQTRLSNMLSSLQQTEDAYMVLGLLTGQVFNLAALSVADKPSAEVAKDLGAHPYALSKLSSQSQRLGRVRAGQIIEIFAEADEAMKMSSAEPWLLIERALLKVMTVAK